MTRKHLPALDGLRAGVLLGLIAYWLALRLFEKPLARYWQRLVAHRWLVIAGDLVIFVWIWQVAVEFHEGHWLQQSLHYFIK